jgi:hypothetical protein
VSKDSLEWFYNVFATSLTRAATSTPTPSTKEHPSRTTAAEEIREYISTKPSKVVFPTTLLKPLEPISIVNLPLLRIRENVVSERDLLESVSGSRVFVWVELLGEPVIRLQVTRKQGYLSIHTHIM